MKYRIVRQETFDDDVTYTYIIERKEWFFWYSLCEKFQQQAIEFATAEQAEEYLYKVIKWNTPPVVKRTIIKEIP
jgi:hypothetical protein